MNYSKMTKDKDQPFQVHMLGYGWPFCLRLKLLEYSDTLVHAFRKFSAALSG